MKVPIPTSAKGFIEQWLPLSLLKFLTDQTNSYAEWSASFQPDLFGQKWVTLSVTEMAQYLGLRILMGINKLPHERMHWARNKFYGNSVFHQTMSFERFKLISKYFHANDKDAVPKGYNSSSDHDRMLLVKPLIDFIRQRANALYTPEMNLSLDEAMMPWKGKLNIKVFNPLKPVKYGVKIYMICEATTGYLLDLLVYDGKSRTLRDIIFFLSERFHNQGYRLFMDNFYNNVKITEELYDNKTHTVGTLRMNRGAPQVLKEFAKNKQPRNSLMYRKKRIRIHLLYVGKTQEWYNL